jgi:hypothetical protein
MEYSWTRIQTTLLSITKHLRQFLCGVVNLISILPRELDLTTADRDSFNDSSDLLGESSYRRHSWVTQREAASLTPVFDEENSQDGNEDDAVDEERNITATSAESNRSTDV